MSNCLSLYSVQHSYITAQEAVDSFAYIKKGHDHFDEIFCMPYYSGTVLFVVAFSVNTPLKALLNFGHIWTQSWQHQALQNVKTLVISLGFPRYGLTTIAEFINPEIAQEQFLGK